MKKTKAIRFERHGGSQVLEYRDVELPALTGRQVLIRQHACGVNYVDIAARIGRVPSELPSGIGIEAAGEVLDVGPQATLFKPGDRVGYLSGPVGAYAQERVMDESWLVGLPDSVSYETAAAIMLKGMTAEYLLRRVFPVQAGQTILFHAAAGGVGLFAMQWAKALGATVIGTVGSPAKAELAMAHGCDHVILYREENIVERVREITDGAMVPVVYDSVGKDTFRASLDSLRPRGYLVCFGFASGPVPPIEMSDLRGSLYVTRPSMTVYSQQREDLVSLARDLFDMHSQGKMKVDQMQKLPLSEAARAHDMLEQRRTTGSTVLIPSMV